MCIVGHLSNPARMRKLRATHAIVAALTVVIAALIAELLLLPPPKQAVSIALSGNSGSGSATFYVTNRESRAIFLACVEVQIRSNGAWKTFSKKTSAILDRTAGKTYVWSGKLAAGNYRAVSVDPPANGAWRVSLTYLAEVGGLTTRLARLLSSTAGGTWYSQARHQVLSQEMAQ